MKRKTLYKILLGTSGLVALTSVAAVTAVSCSTSSKNNAPKVKGYAFNAFVNSRSNDQIDFNPSTNPNSIQLAIDKLRSLGNNPAQIQNEFKLGLLKFFELYELENHRIEASIAENSIPTVTGSRYIEPTTEFMLGQIVVDLDIKYEVELDDYASLDNTRDRILTQHKTITLTPKFAGNEIVNQITNVVKNAWQTPSGNNNVDLEDVIEIYFGEEKDDNDFFDDIFDKDLDDLSWEKNGIFNTLKLINNNVNQYAKVLGFDITLSEAAYNPTPTRSYSLNKLWAPSFTLNAVFYPTINDPNNNDSNTDMNGSLNNTSYSYIFDRNILKTITWNEFKTKTLTGGVESTVGTGLDAEKIYTITDKTAIDTLLSYYETLGFKPNKNIFNINKIVIDLDDINNKPFSEIDINLYTSNLQKLDLDVSAKLFKK